MNKTIISNVLSIFKKLLLAHILFLVFMSIFRLVFFNYYSLLDSLEGLYLDIFNAFFGFRIDLTVIGYIQAIPTIILIILYYVKR